MKVEEHRTALAMRLEEHRAINGTVSDARWDEIVDEEIRYAIAEERRAIRIEGERRIGELVSARDGGAVDVAGFLDWIEKRGEAMS